VQQIDARALAGHSMCVLGRAGIGKRCASEQLKQPSKAAGQSCQAICLTHTNTRNVGRGAVTAHSLAQQFVSRGTYSGQVVLIDEISFMTIGLLAALEHLSLQGLRLICFGDFGQLPPVCNC
jgi:hypothetical protein